MKRSLLACLLSIAALSISGCGSDAPGPGPNPCDTQKPTGTVGDGDHKIDVTQPDGSVDSVWIHAVSPAGEGPFPVVVFAPGQDNHTMFNCAPQRAGVPEQAKQRALGFAALGYLAVAVGFRNEGSTAPPQGTLRPRDHYLLDTRAFLAAAQWARLEHGKGSRHMAFVGHGLGTLPATWATTDMAGLSDLQTCLDVKTLMLAGGTANMVSWANVTDEDETVDDLRVQLHGVVSLIMNAVSGHARGLALEKEIYGVDDITPASLNQGPLADRLFQDLTAEGLQLLRVLAFDPVDTTLVGCGQLAGLSATCTLDCTEWTTRKYVNFDDNLIIDLSHWATDHGILAVGWWDPPAKVSPAESDMQGSKLLGSLMRGSPVYAAKATRAGRLLHLSSPTDPNHRPDAQALLAQKFGALGVATVQTPAIASDPMAGACDHESYFDPTKPTCGWLHVSTELTEALPPPSAEEED